MTGRPTPESLRRDRERREADRLAWSVRLSAAADVLDAAGGHTRVVLHLRREAAEWARR